VDSHLWAFVLVAALLAVTPGADTLLVVRNVLSRGRAAGLATIAGIAGGCLVHATLSAVGVALLLVRSAEAFATLKWCGAVYLVVLGVQSLGRWWRADTGEASAAPSKAPPAACARCWRACSPTC
jgi:threonine/homoserine/homoserine lactone efflux protein